MGNKKIIKEEEKIERMIRALLKLPENKRCINCNLLVCDRHRVDCQIRQLLQQQSYRVQWLEGPQYVCTTFLTFVCTTCSGIQEFTHRVKSVSMAKFSEEEVVALQAAGNERAREIYFKAWDPKRHSLPDCSNLHRLRDFIKHVYVDRKYTGERSDRLPSLRLGQRVDSSESRKVSVFRSKSPLDEDRHERSSAEGSTLAGRIDAVRGFYKETRSPQYVQENSSYGGSFRSPRCIEIVDNRVRCDGPGSARRQDNHSFPRREPVTRSGSSEQQIDRSASPVVRPGNAPPALQVGEHSKANAGKDLDGSAKNQKIGSSAGMESLIDFSMDSEPFNAEAAPNMQQVTLSSDDGNQSDELSSKGNAPPVSNANTLESLLFDLSAPSVAPLNNVSAVPGTAGAPSTASGQNITSDSVSSATPVEQLLSLTSTNGSSTVPPLTNAPQKPSNPVTSSPTHNAQQSSNVSSQQSPQSTSKPSEETSSEVGMQPVLAETKSGGRKELPEDLFTLSYVSAPAAVTGGQNGLPYGTGFGLHLYPNAMHGVAFPSTAKANPFDLNSDTTPAQSPPFASMASLLVAHPSVQDPTGLSHTPSFDAHASEMASHSSYLESLRTPESRFTSAIPSSGYTGNQSNIGLPSSRPQGIDGTGSYDFTSGFSGAAQRPTTGRSASNPPNSSHTMGANPF